jgi:acyl-CoA thioester hydrolase
MARIRIPLPNHFLFTTRIAVRITDLNYGDHVGNDSVLAILHEARMQFMQQYGYTEMQAEGVSLIMSDAAIEFKKELYYGDTLIISVTPGDWSSVGFDLLYKIETERQGQLQTAVAAKTGMVCYDYEQKKIMPAPAALKFRVESSHSQS